MKSPIAPPHSDLFRAMFVPKRGHVFCAVCLSERKRGQACDACGAQPKRRQVPR